MDALPHFITLGGHGGYVWASVLMCALVAVLEVAWLRHRRHKALQAVRALHESDAPHEAVRVPSVRQIGAAHSTAPSTTPSTTTTPGASCD